MLVTDMVILPLGCLLCGLLSASGLLLRSLPALRRLVESLLPRKATVGLVTTLAGLISLFFPYYGPTFIGSLFPATAAVVVGVTLSLELLLDLPLLHERRRALARIGNALLYLRNPLGVLCMTSGVLHLCFPAVPFL